MPISEASGHLVEAQAGIDHIGAVVNQCEDRLEFLTGRLPALTLKCQMLAKVIKDFDENKGKLLHQNKSTGAEIFTIRNLPPVLDLLGVEAEPAAEATSAVIKSGNEIDRHSHTLSFSITDPRQLLSGLDEIEDQLRNFEIAMRGIADAQIETNYINEIVSDQINALGRGNV